MTAGVDLDNVCADFGTFRAVDRVNVNIQPGEFFSFLGPSGCGKTTILRMISGFTNPSEGVIRIGGKDMKNTRPNQRPTALIFQNLALFPLMPVWENIAFGLEVRGVDKNTRRAKAEELLRLVDLPDAADKRVSQLSGGQKQRVAIARALAVEPDVMLLDEPLSALDLKLRQHMRAELRAIQKRTQVTFIYITHDQGEALAMSDRVGVMSQGKLQQVATPREIYDAPANGFVASFVGENNIFSGEVAGAEGAFATFRTASGTFQARLGPNTTGAKTRLFLRPEHVTLQAGPGALNSIPVEVTDVAFEGNFISIQSRDSSGQMLVAEARNDGAATVPKPGEKLHMVFDPAHALILAGDTAAKDPDA
ncbi:ABC transporter ATP-binding protein [Fertoebacter nigrum]|uniref:ABC transporter ATP-binding protein n=1 Tax=Fertoeibacter niger TaxID=2656921 RepID=A0A8X8GSZ7_9RHOB|nr:ABC transporter ATP-binding protein [Fertoeibacter niger]NUB43794.1 ABC transporter ATP-binding protein [Fertoeibacter niger]